MDANELADFLSQIKSRPEENPIIGGQHAERQLVEAKTRIAEILSRQPQRVNELPSMAADALVRALRADPYHLVPSAAYWSVWEMINDGLLEPRVPSWGGPIHPDGRESRLSAVSPPQNREWSSFFVVATPELFGATTEAAVASELVWEFEPGIFRFKGKPYDLTDSPKLLLQEFVRSRRTAFGNAELKNALENDQIEQSTLKSHLCILRKVLREVAKDFSLSNECQQNPIPHKTGAWRFLLPRHDGVIR